MKHLIPLLLFLFPPCLLAQRHDNVWLWGYDNRYATPNNNGGGYRATFGSSSLVLTRDIKPMDFYHFTSSMCDSAGHLQFYSNGLRIANRFHQTMMGGDSIGYNNGNAWRRMMNSGGSRFKRAGFAIPFPASRDIYYFFHDSYASNQRLDTIYSLPNYLSIIDMRGDQGRGRVTKRDSLLMNKVYYHPTGCKHANGRDWWVVHLDDYLHKVLKTLVTPDGISSISEDSIGVSPPRSLGHNNALFSQDGSKYAYCSNNGYVKMYDFDRCDGSFSNEVVIPTDTIYYETWAAFSPSGRYIYQINAHHIIQIDLLTAHPYTRDTILIGYDGVLTTDTFVNFAYPQLMPDGKIYMIDPFWGYAIHVIHAPDSPGAAARPEAWHIRSPVVIFSSMPYLPNYRLGPLRGSGCDTLTSLSPPTPDPKGEVKVYPNPTSGKMTLEFTLPLEEDCQLVYYDAQGRRQASFAVPKGSSLLDVELYLPAAIYYVRLEGSGVHELLGKVVILRD